MQLHESCLGSNSIILSFLGRPTLVGNGKALSFTHELSFLSFFLCFFLANVNSCWVHVHVRYMSSSVRLSVVCRLSVTFVHPTQPIEIFGNVSAPFNTLMTWRHPGKILRRSSQRNPSVGGLNQRVVEKCSNFGPLQGYISEMLQDRR